jgi:ATP-dependent Clp protease ATP-binding subunit ClpC
MPVTPKPGDLEHILIMSEDQARILGHGFIGTEHILLGLIAEGHGAGAQVLKEFGVTLEGVRSKVQEIIETTGPSGGGSLPQTPRVQKAVECARLDVVHFGHIAVGSGHLLLGLITEGEGVAARVLNDLRVDFEQLRAATLTAMGVRDETA